MIQPPQPQRSYSTILLKVLICLLLSLAADFQRLLLSVKQSEWYNETALYLPPHSLQEEMKVIFDLKPQPAREKTKFDLEPQRPPQGETKVMIDLEPQSTQHKEEELIIDSKPQPGQNETKRIFNLQPMKVLNRYIKWHSNKALQLEEASSMTDLKNRTFAIGYYSCPMQAGNRLTHFFNSLLWAMYTNRTLLWKYFDNETCTNSYTFDKRYTLEIADGVCSFTGSESSCAKVLTRASWIPSYDEWKGKLSLGEPERLPYWSTNPKGRNWYKEHYPWVDGVSNEQQGIDAKGRHIRLVDFPIRTAMEDGPSAATYIDRYLLHTKHAAKTLRRLYKEGHFTLYGMLFRRTFDFAFPYKTVHFLPSSDTFSIGIHSRHQKRWLGGGIIKSEMRCLEQIMEKRGNRTCVALLMSDRQKTLNKLSAWLEARNCSALISNHTKGESFLDEHGMFAGVGYFQDLALVSQARDAFVGSQKTSSALVEALIRYDRKIESSRTNNLEGETFTCNLPMNNN